MKNRIRFATLLLAATAPFASAPFASAQTGTQQYTATVPVSIQLTAPAAAALTHDESDDDQAFPSQTWAVSANNLAGVTVRFETDQPFTHTTDNSFQRDARLDLAVGTTSGPATWTLAGGGTDQTDFASNDDVASVEVSSDGVGLADLDLTVTFITDQFGVFAAGDYQMTVTGTVTAN